MIGVLIGFALVYLFIVAVGISQHFAYRTIDRGAGRTRGRRTGVRPWGLNIFRQTGGPMFSLGIHVDLHTPTIDLHIGQTCVQLGRNQWDGRRFVYTAHRWGGHSDNCDHPRVTPPAK